MLYGSLVRDPKGNLADEGRERYASLVEYLSFLREQAGRDLGALDLSTIDGLEVVNGKLKILNINKGAINRAIAEMPKRAVESVPGLLLDQIRVAQRQVMRERIAQANHALEQRIIEARDYSARMMNAFAESLRLRLEVEHLGGNDSVLAEHINKIQEDGFWKVETFNTSSGKLRLTTADDVWVNFNDTAAQVNKTYNAGKMDMSIQIVGSMTLVVTPRSATEAIVIDNFYHPHLSSTGVVCLGNTVGSFQEAVRTLDLFKIAKIIQSILTTYCPDNPYRAFARFYDEYASRERLKVRVLNEQTLRTEYQARIEQHGDDLDFYDSVANEFIRPSETTAEMPF